MVTGSTAGIGRAIAEGLARAGAVVVINGRGEDRVDAALRDLRALFPAADLTGYSADLATSEGAEAFASQAGNADILVNNVGTANPKPFLSLTDGDWRNFFELDVMSGVRMTRHDLTGDDDARLGTCSVHQQQIGAGDPQGHDGLRGDKDGAARDLAGRR